MADVLLGRRRSLRERACSYLVQLAFFALAVLAVAALYHGWGK